MGGGQQVSLRAILSEGPRLLAEEVAVPWRDGSAPRVITQEPTSSHLG